MPRSCQFILFYGEGGENEYCGEDCTEPSSFCYEHQDVVEGMAVDYGPDYDE